MVARVTSEQRAAQLRAIAEAQGPATVAMARARATIALARQNQRIENWGGTPNAEGTIRQKGRNSPLRSTDSLLKSGYIKVKFTQHGETIIVRGNVWRKGNYLSASQSARKWKPGALAETGKRPSKPLHGTKYRLATWGDLKKLSATGLEVSSSTVVRTISRDKVAQILIHGVRKRAGFNIVKSRGRTVMRIPPRPFDEKGDWDNQSTAASMEAYLTDLLRQDVSFARIARGVVRSIGEISSIATELGAV